MLDAIANITPQPVRYAVIGSDHADHTGGNGAFPALGMFRASVEKVVSEGHRLHAAGVPLARAPRSAILG
ncbi:MAG: hypothetical protein FJW14_06665 [Acidimicrobiia bacterium]|nr:hypothetical protein [Acidimicrobiia bacterium]